MQIFFYCNGRKGVKLFGEFRDWPQVPPVGAEVYLSGSKWVCKVHHHHWCDMVQPSLDGLLVIKNKPMVTVRLVVVRRVRSNERNWTVKEKPIKR